MLTNIGERLRAARHQQWVGRAEEVAVFLSILEPEELACCVLHIHGPGGVGKTTLLNVFTALCKTREIRAIRLDARNIEPTPASFLQCLAHALGLEPSGDPVDALNALSSRAVLFVDTYEALDGLDGWIREIFVPGLSGDILVVLSGRMPPTSGWRSESGWQDMLRIIALRNLSPEESCAYLEQHAIPANQQAAILEWTHGFPLALSLVADVFAQRGSLRFDRDSAQDVVTTLLERLLQKVPDADHRAALETCALVHLTTESLLAELNPEADAPTLFRWLRGLSFMEAGSRGLFPHDIAREALLSELRWRNPERYADLHSRARAYYTARLKETQGQEQQRILMDYIFLHRDNAIVRSAFQWHDNAAFAELARPEDKPALVAMTEKQEGLESGRIVKYWLDQPCQQTIVFRESLEARTVTEPLGFVMMVMLEKVDAQQKQQDPAIKAACYYLEKSAPLRPGETALYYRFWMARDTYQDVSPIQSLIVVNMVRHDLTTPHLAFTFFPCRDTEFWAPVLAYAQKQALPQADFVVGEWKYGVFGHDWRTLPLTVWLSILAEQETAGERQIAPPRGETLLVLSEPEFGAAVREALRHLQQPESLRHNPLLRSRLVLERAQSNADDSVKADALIALVTEAALSCQSSPKLARGYRALHHTYLDPAPTQEQAADLLQLPFSTYRRHLLEGIAHVVERLWLKEIGETSKDGQKMSSF